MRGKKGLAMVGLVAAGAVLFALLFILGPIAGFVSARGDPWDEMYAACQSGDHAAMVSAMRDALNDEQFQAMQRHMESMHPNGMGQMHQGMMSGGMMQGGSMMGRGMMDGGQQCPGGR
jgi:hypothetical protein